ncbi:MAG TPA: twin-arginine translocation signal domain-containing protein [Jatrophihabitans sp.]|nr:twin-arginine translocation signal domain-containing protein [Jatrophihabitans sp.]
MKLAERLVNRLATIGSARTSRRNFLAAATLTGTALAVDPWGYLTRPQSAYATACGPGANCGDGWSAMCCSINGGRNTCPPNTFRGGWWKADRSSFCGGNARYYIDCNALPGHHFTCHCNQSNCDHRYVACNVFRYGQCNTQIHGVTAVVCRQISCIPPWQLYPRACGSSSRTDNNTAQHTAPCLAPVTFPPAPLVLAAGHRLSAGERIVSRDRHTDLRMRPDGNLVLRNQSGVVWSTNTANTAAGGHAVLGNDGRLRVVDAHGTIRFSTHNPTTGATPTLRIFNVGQLVILRDATVVWRTYTHTP